MATTKVFQTVELLEAILLQLPIRDVLVSQRVARIWRDTICGSVQIQRALFFQPTIEASTACTRRIHLIDLDTPCELVLQTPNIIKTLVTDILPVVKSSNSVLSSSTPLLKSTDDDTSNWKRMLSTQPPRPQEHFFGNFASQAEMPITDASLQFNSKDQVSQSGKAVIERGTMFNLGAVKVEGQNGVVTLGEVMKALDELSLGWDCAKLKGRKEGDFGWVGFRELDAVVSIWEDIKEVTEDSLCD